MSQGTVIFSIAAKNYLPFVRCLMASVQRYHPDAHRVLLLVDTVDGYFDPEQEDYDIIRSTELPIRNSKWFHFKYKLLELSTAVKPYAIELLLEKYNATKVIYLDPDILLFRPVDTVMLALRDASIVLTPHLTETLDDDLRPDELDILRSGVYNLGFIAVRASENTGRFLRWWQQKVYDQCVVAPSVGVFVDQKWIDLVPGLYSDVAILRDSGLNVAYWNLKYRKIIRNSSDYLVNGEPLAFFHFSGFDPRKPEDVSKHQTRLRLSQLGGATSLFLDYRRQLFSYGYQKCRSWPNAYASFANGARIPDLLRQVRYDDPDVVTRIQDPFADEGYESFCDYWNTRLWDKEGRPTRITRAAYRIHELREDLRTVMPDILGRDQTAFLKWLGSSGRSETGLDYRFLSPMLEEVARSIPPEPLPPDLPPVCHAILKGSGPTQKVLTRSSVTRWFNEIVERRDSGWKTTRLAQRIYDERPDVRAVFPVSRKSTYVRFLEWFITSARVEYQLGEDFVQPMHRLWREAVASLPDRTSRARCKVRKLALALAAPLRAFVYRSNHDFARHSLAPSPLSGSSSAVGPLPSQVSQAPRLPKDRSA